MNRYPLQVIDWKALSSPIADQTFDWQSLRQRSKSNVLILTENQSILDSDVYWEVNRALRYVDSMSVRIAHRLEDPTAGGLLFRKSEAKPGGFVLCSYIGIFKTRSGATVLVRNQPFSREGLSYITLTFSGPKVVQRNNYKILPPGTDIIGRLDYELAPILSQLNIPPVSVYELEIRRIDLCVNWQVGEDLYRYQDFIKTRVIERRVRGDFNNLSKRRPSGIDPHTNGTCFYSQSVRITVYAKEPECKHPLADGVLRMEPSYRKPKAVWKLFQKHGTTQVSNRREQVKDLHMPIVEKALQEALALTGLGNTIVSKKTLYEQLLKVFTPRKALGMMSFILLEQQYPGKSSKEAAEIYKCSPETVRRKRKLLRDAGISAWGDEAYDLPGLRLDFGDDPVPVIDGNTGWLTLAGTEGESCGKVPQYICFPAGPAQSHSAPNDLEMARAPALADELLGKTNSPAP